MMELAHSGEDGKNIVASRGEWPPVFGNDAHVQPSSCSVASPVLDPSIWSNTPEGVLYLVFSRLPLKSRFRIRSLSKLWRSTDFFSKETAGEQRRDRFALVKSSKICEQQEVWVFDTPAQEWCKFRLNPFPSSRKFSGPFATAGGLLCYISETSSSTVEVMVGNPLTQTYHLLPQNLTLTQFPTLAHMSMAGVQYSITLVELSSALIIETYDSFSNTWHSSSPAAPTQLSSYYNFFKNGEYQGLASMDTSSGDIERLMYPSELQESPFLSRVEEKCWIVQSRGSLFMCSNAPRKGGVWQTVETKWQRVGLFPQVLQQYESTALFVSDEVMLLVGSAPRCFPPQFEDADPHKMVMLNNVTQQWSILPSVSSCFGPVDELLGGFMFQPSFDVTP